MSRRLRTGFVLLAAAALALLGWRAWQARADRHAAAAGATDTTQAGMRAVTLWFADESGDSLVSEVREVVEQEGLHERVAQLVAALDQGPLHHGVATLPAGTSVLHAYLDDRGLLTLDLSRAFQQGFRGGSRAEDFTIGSLVRTLAANLPEARRVLFACGGAPIGSIGGHVPLDRPIDLHGEF
jgi:hypothetical protein